MGKPKVPDGVRLSVKLPREAWARLKNECTERRMIEAAVVLEALQKHWSIGEANKSQPSKGTAPLPAFEHLDRGSQAIVRVMKAAGHDPYEPGGEGDQ